MGLEVYSDNGFLLFQCNPDKSPMYKRWREVGNHLTLEAAEMLQSMGEMIGAWIPEDIIIIDLDRHPGKPDGVKSFKKVKEDYNINFDITSETFTVTTVRNGYHIFLNVGKDHKFRQSEAKLIDKEGNEKDSGIDIRTHSGYVITAGCPGYKVHPNVIDLDIIEIPETLRIWLEEVNSRKEKKKKYKPPDESYNIPVSLLGKILAKIDVKLFSDNGKWIEFIMAIKAACGDSQETTEAILKWSAGDPEYDGKEDQTRTRVNSVSPDGGITVGTFIHFMRDHDVSQYYIKKVLAYNMSIELYQNMRDDGTQLPFSEPNYDEISDSKEANELFLTAGNSVAATLLGYAIHGYIIWCEADKEFYLFDGNKWEEYYDMYTISYTILIRLVKFMFAKKRGTDIASENFMALVKAINKTHWKHDTLRELKCRDGIFHKAAKWDSEKLKETLTTSDGVIDFTGEEIIVRKGTRKEFRKSFVQYKTDEIIKSDSPGKYNIFLEGLFPDKDTLLTARQSSSMFISGNAKKVFQVYHGEGDNGKSTWIELEKELLGEKAHTYSTSLILSNKYSDDKLPPEAADFMGKYLLYGSEVQKGKQLSLGKIKNFTGDDTIAATPKYKDQREFRPTWQMVLSVNDLPFFDGTDRAFINRLLILPFEKTFVNSKEMKDELITKGFTPELIDLKIDADKLKAEMRIEFPAIINQKINDYVDLKNNYNGIIKQSEKCIQHKETYVTDNNDIENFLEELCIISLEGNLFTTSESMTDAYHDYMGSSKASSSYVVRTILKARQEVMKITKIIIENKHDPELGEFNNVKVQKRGLSNIRLRTISEIEQALAMNKEYHDEIPF